MKPLFILGYPKSGTSLLVSLLDGHPEINVIPEESDYFDGIYFLVKKLIKTDKVNLKQKINTIHYHITHSTHIRNLFKGLNKDDPRGNFDYRDFKTEAFHESFRNELYRTGISHKLVFNALAKAYMAGNSTTLNKKYWLEKTPYHYVNVLNRESLLDSIFSSYKVIHIIRDPRDNYLSYSKKRPKLSIYDICNGWKKVAYLALNWNIKENNLIIRYEDLVLRNKETMNVILRFLDIKVHDCIYSPTKNGIPWLGNSMFKQKSDKISKDRVDRYLKMITHKKKNIIESCCSEEMKTLNYLSVDYKTKNLPVYYHLARLKSYYKERAKVFNMEIRLSNKY